jgi:K(+)-stimulated pyrophosphate-energized sodium pump
MFDDQDQELGPVLTLVIGLAIVVCLFTIGIALSVAGAFSPQAAGTTAVARAGDPAVAPIHILFAIGSSELPADAANTLLIVVVAATADAKRRIELSGYHDASGDRARNIELAKARARTVGDALRAAGVADDRIVFIKPAEVLGGSDPALARRVDLTLR